MGNTPTLAGAAYQQTAGWLAEVLTNSTLHAAHFYQICNALREGIAHYDWVGFYWVSRQEKNLLELGPYVGLPTEHTRIPFGRGVCGTSAQTHQRMIVPDVSASDNYLACSLQTRAEWVEPIFVQSAYFGQLDIDSHTPEPFSEDDHLLLSWLCTEIGLRI